MAFTKKPLKWTAVGQEPSELKKSEGFKMDESPAPGHFDFMFRSTYEAIEELQQKAGEVKTVNNIQPDSNGNVLIPLPDVSKFYQKPTAGIHKTDLESSVQTALTKAESALQSVTKTDVGLGNVDNTSDANKPISTAQQTALNLKANIASPTFTGTPKSTTAAAGTNTTQIATTAFVKTAVDNSATTINDSITTHQADLASQSSGKGASLIGINDSGNKFTATTVEGALSELFQFANDGKTNIATVVGSPTLSSDTFSKITSDIQLQKNNLATNLTNKGQSSTGTETLKVLVDKVANVNTGKKWASGSGSSSSSRVGFSNGTGATLNAYTITVNGLDFNPTIVLVQDLSSNAVAVVNLSQPLNSGYHVGWADAIGLVRVVDNFYLQNGGFQVPSYYGSKSVNWIAFE